jgi:Concanavalin A-like lectin/glucanases superfamily
MRGSLLLAGTAALLAAGAATGSPAAPNGCPATCIHVGSTLNPVRASASVGAPIGFLAVDGRAHRLSGAFFSVTALRAKAPPVIRLSAGSYGFRDSTGAGSGRVLVLPRVSLSGRTLHATWAAAGTPGRAWRVWLRIGGKESTWLAKTSARSGSHVVPKRAAQACVSAATIGAAGASAVSPPVCVGTAGGDGGSSGLSYRELVLADRPTAFWPFARDAADAIGSHELRLAGGAVIGATGIEGPPDQALLLSGNRQFATSPFAADLNPRTFTLETWARIDGGAGTARKVLVARDAAGLRGLIVEATAADTWKVWLGHGAKSWDSIAGPAVQAHRWTHLVVTFDGAAASLYADGVKAGSVFTPFAPNPQGDLSLGAGRSGAGAPAFFFVGALDDVAVYRGPLSPQRVAAHFKAARR